MTDPPNPPHPLTLYTGFTLLNRLQKPGLKDMKTLCGVPEEEFVKHAGKNDNTQRFKRTEDNIEAHINAEFRTYTCTNHTFLKASNSSILVPLRRPVDGVPCYGETPK